jgi:predicted N-acetyltransferase YhbS
MCTFDGVATPGIESIIRPVAAADLGACGRICYEAFASISERHGFPRDFSSVGTASTLIAKLIEHPGFCGVVAEAGGQIVGANFIDQRSAIFSVGPVVVDPVAQDLGVGRALVEAVLARSLPLKPPGVRLLQAAYHNRSLSLYSKIGFEVREQFAVMHREPLSLRLSGYAVRKATAGDTAACSDLCALVHGHDRHGEFEDALAAGTAMVVQRCARITGYTTGIGFYAHSVAETVDDIIALIGAGHEMADGTGFLVPMRSTTLMRWCLAHDFRVTYTMNLMSMGLYQEPRGAYLASVGY